MYRKQSWALPSAVHGYGRTVQEQEISSYTWYPPGSVVLFCFLWTLTLHKVNSHIHARHAMNIFITETLSTEGFGQDLVIEQMLVRTLNMTGGSAHGYGVWKRHRERVGCSPCLNVQR